MRQNHRRQRRFNDRWFCTKDLDRDPFCSADASDEEQPLSLDEREMLYDKNDKMIDDAFDGNIEDKFIDVSRI